MHVCVAVVCLSPPAPRLELYHLSCPLPRHQQRTTPVASKAAPTRWPTAPAAYSPLGRSKDRGTSHRPQGYLRILSDQFLFSPAQRMWSPAERNHVNGLTTTPHRRFRSMVPPRGPQNRSWFAMPALRFAVTNLPHAATQPQNCRLPPRMIAFVAPTDGDLPGVGLHVQ